MVRLVKQLRSAAVKAEHDASPVLAPAAADLAAKTQAEEKIKKWGPQLDWQNPAHVEAYLAVKRQGVRRVRKETVR